MAKRPGLIAALATAAVLAVPQASFARLAAPSTDVGSGTAAADSTAAAGEELHSSGMAIVGKDAIQARPASQAEAIALGEAIESAYENPDVMGYPWIDAKTRALDVATVGGRRDAAVERLDEKAVGLGVALRVRTARATVTELNAIREEITGLRRAGVPNASLIYWLEPDHKNNRVIITMREQNDALIEELAARFGTELVAVRIREGGPLAPNPGRDDDSPAFWGGAAITTSTGKACTTAFAWTAGTHSMLTAAHCISTGGTVSYPRFANAGTVAQSSEENWNDTLGTRLYTGQTTFRGDVALIRYTGGRTSAARIYSGGVHTAISSAVSRKSPARAAFGNPVCVNGVNQGEWCGMVTATGGDAWYFAAGIDVWARNVVQAEAVGWHCPAPGDSGAPVYQRRSDGTITAIGVHSGGGAYGAGCAEYFTDIWDADIALAGTVKVST